MENRYFYVQYSFEGGVGAVPVGSKGMLNSDSFKNFMKKLNPNLRNVFILNWVEMSKEDYEVFNYKVDNETKNIYD